MRSALSLIQKGWGIPRWCLRTVPFESRGRCCNRELRGNINPGLNENSDRWKRDNMGSKYKILITSTSFFKAGPVPLQPIPSIHQERKMGEVYGKRLGIIGLGRIGKAVANRAKGFEMEIIAYDVQRDESFAETLGIKFLPLDDLLMEADFVTLHCGLNPPPKGLIGPRELGLMKETAYLINTAM